MAGINPASAVNLWMTSVTITGTGFVPGASVKLVNGTTVINGTAVSVVSDTRITCSLVLGGQPVGKYDVVVKNPNGQEGKLAGGFSVTNICGQGGGAAVSLFVGLVGLVTLAGFGWRRSRR